MQANGVYLINPIFDPTINGPNPYWCEGLSPEAYDNTLSKWQAAQKSTSAKWVVLQIIK